MLAFGLAWLLKVTNNDQYSLKLFSTKNGLMSSFADCLVLISFVEFG